MLVTGTVNYQSLRVVGTWSGQCNVEIVELSNVTHRGITVAPKMLSRLSEILGCTNESLSVGEPVDDADNQKLGTSVEEGEARSACCTCWEWRVCEVLAKIGPRWVSRSRKYLAQIITLIALGSLVTGTLNWIVSLWVHDGHGGTLGAAKNMAFAKMDLEINGTHWYT